MNDAKIYKLQQLIKGFQLENGETILELCEIAYYQGKVDGIEELQQILKNPYENTQ